MATLEDLQKQRANILAQIKGKGGRKNAPNLTKRLAEISGQIRTMRKGTDTGGSKVPGATEKSVEKTNEILGAAQKFGDEFTDKYIPKGTFGTIDAQTSPEMRSFLDRLNAWSQGSGELTSLEMEALDSMRAGLGGYESPEVQAMREAGSMEMDRQLQNQLYNLNKTAAARGIRGGAAGAFASDLGIGRQQAGANLERDLIIKQADEVQRRKEAFSNLIRSTEDARFGRGLESNKLYGGMLGGEEAARTGREMFNVGQNTNEALTRSGTALSGAGLYTGTLGGQEQLDIAKAQLEEQIRSNKAYQDYASKQLDSWTKRMNNQFGSLAI